MNHRSRKGCRWKQEASQCHRSQGRSRSSIHDAFRFLVGIRALHVPLVRVPARWTGTISCSRSAPRGSNPSRAGRTLSLRRIDSLCLLGQLGRRGFVGVLVGTGGVRSFGGVQTWRRETACLGPEARLKRPGRSRFSEGRFRHSCSSDLTFQRYPPPSKCKWFQHSGRGSRAGKRQRRRGRGPLGTLSAFAREAARGSVPCPRPAPCGLARSGSGRDATSPTPPSTWETPYGGTPSRCPGTCCMACEGSICHAISRTCSNVPAPTLRARIRMSSQSCRRWARNFIARSCRSEGAIAVKHFPL